jgi:flavin reductase (DIM6/NTAB) family NADH-FMN oxidoreductase RutF
LKKETIGPSTYLFPMPAVLVGTRIGDRANYLMAAYAGILSHNPPTIGIGLRPSRYSVSGIEDNLMFSVNIPSTDLAVAADYCGIYSGRRVDKSCVFSTFYGKTKNAPMIQECPINLECELTKKVDLGSHTAFFGQILETYTSPNYLTNALPDIKKIDPLIYETRQRRYWQIGRQIGSSHSIGKKWQRE